MASRDASFHEHVLAGAMLAPLKLAFALSLAFVGILVAAWVVDWIFVFAVWPNGVGHLRSILAADLARGIRLAIWQGWMPDLLTGTANFLYGSVFRVTGIHDMGMRFADGAALSIPDTVLRNTYVGTREAIEVAMLGTQLLGVRLATLALMLPSWLLIYVVAAADGLTQRAIRCACGGRESASLYHRAKHLQVAVGGMGIMAVLVWPASSDWRLFGILGVALVGLLARVQWAFYKKHL